jgi:hypothetical protein
MAGVRPDAAYRVGQLQQRQARERGETPPEGPHTTIEGYLSKPDGSGPFPAVVYVHGCSGLSTDTRKRMADRLTAWGLSFNQCWMKSRVTAMARSGASGIAGNQGPVRTERAAKTVPQRCRGEPVSPYS